MPSNEIYYPEWIPRLREGGCVDVSHPMRESDLFWALRADISRPSLGIYMGTRPLPGQAYLPV